LDSYLSVAQAALRLAKRPLTSREIVAVAYRNDLMPSQLFGRTQHKTVGARLSEDILSQRDRSLFYRNQPGKFFLREFLYDPSVPETYRSPIVARRRQRELNKGPALAVSKEVSKKFSSVRSYSSSEIRNLIRNCDFHYTDKLREKRTSEDILVWSFVILQRDGEVLTYRHGRYREGRDSFIKRRSIGFFTPVVDRDHDLFDRGDHGIVESVAKITDFALAIDESGYEDMLAIVSFDCPANFEPLTRRLAINDLHWMRLDQPVNHIEDFDPWSQIVVLRAQGVGSRRGG
jgi:hypothetical protein